MYPTEKQEQRLVAWVNRQRDWRVGVKGRIKRLPRGVPLDGCECVLARALGGNAFLNGDGSWNVTPYRVEPLPKYVREFERRFDEGKFPGLVEEPAKAKRENVELYYERVAVV